MKELILHSKFDIGFAELRFAPVRYSIFKTHI